MKMFFYGKQSLGDKPKSLFINHDDKRPHGFAIWSGPIYACRMRREEWDWPPSRGRYRTLDNSVHFTSHGWDWPIRKKIINIWWRVMMISIKVLLTIALTIMAFGASWLFWTVITL